MQSACGARRAVAADPSPRKRAASDALASAPSDARRPELLAASMYRAILKREPDPVGGEEKAGWIRNGETLEFLVSRMLESAEYRNLVVNSASFVAAAAQSADFVRKLQAQLSLMPQGHYAELFPEDYVGNGEAGKFYSVYRNTGFLEKFLSGGRALDVGYKGYDNPNLLDRRAARDRGRSRLSRL